MTDDTSYDKSQGATVPRVSVLGPPPAVPDPEPPVSKATEAAMNETLERIARTGS